MAPCLLRAAQRAFINADNFFRAAGLIFGRPAVFLAAALAGFLGEEPFFLAAHLAFIAAEIRFLAATLRTRLLVPTIPFGGRPRRGAEPSNAAIA